MPERCYLNFRIFLLFFLEFSCLSWVKMEFGINFFSLFFGLSHPGLDRNNAEMMFFKFSKFFCYFFWNFLDRVEKKRNSVLNFFSLFLGLYHTGLGRSKEGMMFFNFLNFFASSLEFSCPGRVGTEFGQFWIEIMLKWCFLIFWFFLLFFFWNFLDRVG